MELDLYIAVLLLGQWAPLYPFSSGNALRMYIFKYSETLETWNVWATDYGYYEDTIFSDAT